jgi:hypothetical protein
MPDPNHLFAGLRKAFMMRLDLRAGADTPVYLDRLAYLAQMAGSP